MSEDVDDKRKPATMEALRALWIREGIIDPSAPPSQAVAPTVAELVRAQRMEGFRALCPEEFRQAIDRAKIPNLGAWDAADAWDMEAPGLWLWSVDTGRGKSRMAWRLFGRASVNMGKHVLKCSGQSLAEDYFEAHMDGNPRRFYRRMMAPAVVMLDDFDKFEITERNRRAIRELWDEFYSHRKPVLVTANEPISFFRESLGESCVRRMRAVCREIEF